jgi:stage III sporulation protein AB
MAGCLLVIMAGAGIGYIQSRKLAQRVTFLEQLLRLIDSLETEIRFSSSSLIQLLRKYAQINGMLEYLNRCAELANEGIPFTSSWQQAVGSIPREYGLTKDDRQFLIDFGGNLGVSDVEGQVNHCRLHRELAAVRLEQARGDKQKKGRLYTMLGLFAGIGIALLVG